MTDPSKQDQENPEKNSEPEDLLGNVDLEKLLEERVKIDALLQQKFSKSITVMFTDMKGSTSLTGEIGDFEARMLIKKHNDILLPIIQKSGKLVKTMGDGTMSYFERAADGARAAVEIQTALNEFNKNLVSGSPLLVRIGLHTGIGIVEKTDIYGDVVNIGSRFESLADATEIMVSEETYQEIKDEPDLMVLFKKSAKIKGKTDPVNVYQVFWSDDEYEQVKSAPITYQSSGGFVSSSAGGDAGMAGGLSAAADFGSDSTVMFDASTGPRLVVRKTGEPDKTFPMTRPTLILGRGQQANIQLQERYISREHLRFSKEGDQYYVEVLSSTTPLKHRDKAIESRMRLSHEDPLKLGDYTITFLYEDLAPQDEPTSHFDMDAGGATVVASKKGDFEELEGEATVVSAPQATITVEVTDPNKQTRLVELTGQVFEVGRSQKCELMLDDPGVSRKHAKISFQQGQPVIEDLNSQNGTIVNGTPVKSSPLKPGDQIKIGKFMLVFNPSPDTDSLAKTQAVDQSVLKKLKSFWKK